MRPSAVVATIHAAGMVSGNWGSPNDNSSWRKGNTTLQSRLSQSLPKPTWNLVQLLGAAHRIICKSTLHYWAANPFRGGLPQRTGETSWGKMGGGNQENGSGSWQSQGVSNPCLRRERRESLLVMSMGCVKLGAIQVKNCTKKHRF